MTKTKSKPGVVVLKVEYGLESVNFHPDSSFVSVNLNLDHNKLYIHIYRENRDTAIKLLQAGIDALTEELMKNHNHTPLAEGVPDGN